MKTKKPITFQRYRFNDKEGVDFRADCWSAGSDDEWTQMSYFHQGERKWKKDLVVHSDGNGLRIEGPGVSLSLDCGQAGDLRLALEAAHSCHGARTFATYEREGPFMVTVTKKPKSSTNRRSSK